MLRKMCMLLVGVSVSFGPVMSASAISSEDATKKVTRAYEDILGRKPDDEGMRIYRSKMVDDGWTEQQVRNALKKSDEKKVGNVDDIITRAYQDILGRDPDKAGMKNYRSKMIDDGWTEQQVRNALKKSDEKKNGNVDDIITRAYQDILGRDPDKAGLKNYREKMEDEGWSEKQVREALRKSPEAKKKKD